MEEYRRGSVLLCLFILVFLKNVHVCDSVVVWWLRCCTPNAGGLGLIPGQGTRSHRLQLRVLTSQLKRHEIAKLTGSQEEGEGGQVGSGGNTLIPKTA